ncbi:hypothetical protein ES319_A03G184300v1 [Gossypium barbadense]|uniref:Uncharacterized protein n=1 Tax=Gossypium barbadense TaxID=3634 RepID=A0A5J5WIS3_GOSBA|nr:hypothetical protein ES319_A03G184300v1 [Gossypium barbadense]
MPARAPAKGPIARRRCRRVGHRKRWPKIEKNGATWAVEWRWT